jgi:hypothetical protein
MEQRSVSQERVDEAIRIGNAYPGKTENEIVYKLASSESFSGRGIRIVTDKASGRVITVIDKGRKFKR